MRTASRRSLAALAVAAGLWTLFGGVGSRPAAADDKELTQALRAGGLVIVLRHGATFADRADAKPIDFDNITAQRNLNDQGKASAAALGDAFRRIGVPVGKVYTSRFNRAYETAILAGFKQAEKISELTDAGPGMLAGENAGQTEAFRKMLSTAPQPGTNTVLVTHKPNIVDALGKDWTEVKEGEASIFRPANGNYPLVARVQMDDWPRIAAAK
jgi:broad specificity phosphatase PhoE